MTSSASRLVSLRRESNRYRIDIIFRSHAEGWGVLLALAFHSVWVTALSLVAAALVRCSYWQAARMPPTAAAHSLCNSQYCQTLRRRPCTLTYPRIKS